MSRAGGIPVVHGGEDVNIYVTLNGTACTAASSLTVVADLFQRRGGELSSYGVDVYTDDTVTRIRSGRSPQHDIPVVVALLNEIAARPTGQVTYLGVDETVTWQVAEISHIAVTTAGC